MKDREITVLIPNYGYKGERYPGNIRPGRHSVVTLLRKNSKNPKAVKFIADMLEGGNKYE